MLLSSGQCHIVHSKLFKSDGFTKPDPLLSLQCDWLVGPVYHFCPKCLLRADLCNLIGNPYAQGVDPHLSNEQHPLRPYPKSAQVPVTEPSSFVFWLWLNCCSSLHWCHSWFLQLWWCSLILGAGSCRPFQWELAI